MTYLGLAGFGTYGYDVDGRRTSAITGTAATSYTYDPAGNLHGVATPDAVVGYTSNGDGLRASRTVDGVEQQFEALGRVGADVNIDTYVG